MVVKTTTFQFSDWQAVALTLSYNHGVLNKKTKRVLRRKSLFINQKYFLCRQTRFQFSDHCLSKILMPEVVDGRDGAAEQK